jgi:hypothetical protein
MKWPRGLDNRAVERHAVTFPFIRIPRGSAPPLAVWEDDARLDPTAPLVAL